MATKDEVSRAIERLMARLDGNEANVRSAIPPPTTATFIRER